MGTIVGRCLCVFQALGVAALAVSCSDGASPSDRPPAAVISIDGSSISWSIRKDYAVYYPPRTIAITNAGSGALTGLALSIIYEEGISGWIVAALNSANAPATLTAQYDATGLAPGEYRATITIRSPDAAAPAVIRVSLTVAPPYVDYLVASPRNIHLVPGGARQLTLWRVEVSNRRTQQLTDRRWVSLDPTIATVTSSGLVTAVGPGTTAIVDSAVSITVTVRSVANVRFRQVVVAGSRACALSIGGIAYCWGEVDAFSPEGKPALAPVLGTTSYEIQETPILAVGGPGGHMSSHGSTYLPVPSPVESPVAFESLGFSGSEACGVTADRAVYCWGFSYLRGGAETTVAQRALPGVAVAAVSPPCVLTMAAQATCYASTSTLRASWSHAPAVLPLPAAVKWASVAGSLSTGVNCAIDDAGRGYCWGTQCAGNLGIGPDSTQQFNCRAVNEPQLLKTDLRFKSLINSCGLDAEGRAYCTGVSPNNGQAANSVVMGPVANAPRFVSLATGTARCGLTETGEAYCWGTNVVPRDLSKATTSASAVLAAPAVPLRSISTGELFSCGMGRDEALYCWGAGSLGDGMRTLSFEPSRVVRIGAGPP